MAERETKTKTEQERTRHRQEAQTVADSAKQGGLLEYSQLNEVLGGLSLMEQSFLFDNPGLLDTQKAGVLLALQQSHGNKYVADLLEGNSKTDNGVVASETKPGNGARPLEANIRKDMEKAFNKDLRNVKIVEDDGVATSSGSLAVTTGETIHFAPGKYEPQTTQGRQILGHELAHHVQQTKGGNVTGTYEDLEAEAEQAGREAAAGRTSGISQSAVFGRPQGMPPGSVPPSAVSVTPTETTVAAVVKAKDPDMVSDLTDDQIKKASIADRLILIRLISKQTWVGPLDEKQLERIWGTFPAEALSELLKKKENYELWNKCVEQGAELDKLDSIKSVKSLVEKHFKKDVKATAYYFLDENYIYASKEYESVGGDQGISKSDQIARIDQLRNAARHVQLALKGQQGCRSTIVGSNIEVIPDDKPIITKGPAFFNPKKKPDYPPSDTEKAYMKSWDAVNKEYQNFNEIIEYYTSKYPTIYGFLKDERIDELLASRDAEEAGCMIRQVLWELRLNIIRAKLKLEHDDLDYRDLWPVHEQLYKGLSPAANITVDWKNPIAEFIGREVVKGHENAKFWLSMGLSSLSAALFVVAAIASGGAATAFFAVGGAISAAQPIASWSKYMDLAHTSKLTLSKELALVSEDQVRSALIEATLDSAFAFLDLYGAAKGIGTALRAGRTPIVKEALIAGEQAAQAAKTAIPKTIDLADPNARELLERAVGELGVSEASHRAKATPQELLEIVGRDSPSGKAIETYQKKVTELAQVPVFFTTEEIPSRLAKLAALAHEVSKDAADKLVLQSMNKFGPKRTVEMAGGWDKLSVILGKGTAAGEQLEAWRSTLYADLEKYIKETLGGDLRRTGTPGFTSDLDITLLGENAAANRNKARSYLAGRAGVSPDDLKYLLHCDMFTDPRLMHLYDVLPDAIRKQLSEERALFEQELVWNRRLYEAKEMGDPYLVMTIRKQMKEAGVVEKVFKPLSKPDIARLEQEIGSLYKKLMQAKDPSIQAKLVQDIGQKQALINATEGGGYFTGGGVRKFVSERPGETIPPLGKAGLAQLPAERVTAVIDQLAKLDKEGSELVGHMLAIKTAPLGIILDIPALVQNLKSIGKYGDRITQVVREAFGETIPNLPRFDDMAQAFENLLKGAREGKLQQSFLEGRANVLVSRAKGALNELEQSSLTLLRLLSEHAEIKAAAGGFAKIQRMVIIHAKFLRAKDAFAKLLPTLVLDYIQQYVQSGAPPAK